MIDISITCLIAYGMKKNYKNLIILIDKLSTLKKNNFKNIKINIVIGWNKNNGIESFNYNKELLNNVSLKIIEVPDKYKNSSKAYHTWSHLIKHINLDDNFYFFFKDNYFSKINPDKINSFIDYNILNKYHVVYYETVKNINKNFIKKKIAYNTKDNSSLFPRTQIFLINNDVFKNLLKIDFFFSNKFQIKHRQYDLFKITIKYFKNYSFILKTCDDTTDTNVIKITKNINLNKII